MTPSSLTCGNRDKPMAVRVRSGRDHGWDLQVEIDGRVVHRESFTDWHRLERRRAWLKAAQPRGSPPKRVHLEHLACLALLVVTAAPAATQDTRDGFFTEPRAVERAVRPHQDVEPGAWGG